jgi:hypothetical protein
MNIDCNLSSFIRQSLTLPTIITFCVVRLFACRVAECYELCSGSDGGHMQKLTTSLLPQSFLLCVLTQGCFKPLYFIVMSSGFSDV